MKIHYEDEYETTLYIVDANNIPSINDQIVIGGNEYTVTSRIFFPEKDGVVIMVTESSASEHVAENTSDSGRLNQLNAAIINTNKRVDATDKKNRALGEQVSSVKKHINQRIKQDKKDQNENR